MSTSNIGRLRRTTPTALFGCALLCAAGVMAQDEEGTTPGAIANPGSYQGSMQLQQQEQQQSQQQEQQNQAMLQRLNQNYQQSAPNAVGAAAGGGQGRAAPAVNWWNRPALTPEHNPLLGRWQQIASKGVSAQLASGPLAGLLPAGTGDMINGAMAGGCKSMFGSGVIAFEPTALQWVAPDGHEEILNNVAYRANGAEVIVLTKDPGAVPALIFGFPDHDRAVVAFFNCTMDRVGAKPRAAASQPRTSAPATQTTAATTAAAVPAGSANAVVDLQAAMGAAGHHGPLAGLQFWVTPQNPLDALTEAGIMPAGRTSLGEFLNAESRIPANFIRDLKVMTAKALGFMRTDAAGHARTPPFPSGRYYIVGVAPDNTKVLFWNLPIDARAGSNAVTLNQANGATLPH